VSESVVPTIASIGGGFLTGIMIGYFVKKIIKILIFVAGGIVGLLLYLQQQEIISIKTENLESLSGFILASLTSSIDKATQIDGTTSLGIPLTASIAAGFKVGIVKA
jgi:uncharacterized membrane protein (Fun14 family)